MSRSSPVILRKSKRVNYKEIDSDDDLDDELNTQFFNDTSYTDNMATQEELLQQIETLRVELARLTAQQHVQPNIPLVEEPVAPNTRRVVLPKFNSTNPDLWFTQVERCFRLNGVVNDVDKFDHVLVQLDGDVMLSVEDLAVTPPENDKFKTLKDRLIATFAQTAESKLRRMLRGEDAAGKRPSAILAHMKHLASGQCGAAVLRSLFLEKMPESIRPVLVVSEVDDLDKLAAMADKMVQATNMHISRVDSSSSSTFSQPPPTLQSTNDPMNQAIIDAIKTGFSQLQRSRSGHRRSISRPRRAYSNENNKSDSTLCYYHERFGDDARKCRAPCSRSNTNSGN